MLTLSIGRKKRLHAVTFSPSGRDLAAVGGDNVLRVWDSFTGDLKHSALRQSLTAKSPIQETRPVGWSKARLTCAQRLHNPARRAHQDRPSAWAKSLFEAA